jgi:hypothetical protein
MTTSAFTDTALHAFLDAGHSQAHAARHFGVSEAAIHERLKRMRRLTSQVVALEHAGTVVDDSAARGIRSRGRRPNWPGSAPKSNDPQPKRRCWSRTSPPSRLAGTISTTGSTIWNAR